MKPIRGLFAASLAALLFLLVLSAPASATTWCVPSYFSGCPNDETNLDASNSGALNPSQALESAMNSTPSPALATDGIPDTILIDVGTIIDPDQIETSGAGTDDLTIQGSGRDQTFLTSSSTGNDYVLNTYFVNRKITVKDLGIVIPESFPDSGGGGAGVQSKGDDFESVDMIVRNDGANGFGNVEGGGRFTDIHMFGVGGAGFLYAFNIFNNPCEPGTVEIDGMTISDADYGLRSECGQSPIEANDLRIKEAGTAIYARNSAHISLQNSLVESGIDSPVLVENDLPGGDNSVVAINHTTIVATGDPTKPAIRAIVTAATPNSASIQFDVRNTILSGFQKSWDLSAPASGTNHGKADLNLVYSNYGGAGVNAGDTTVNTAANVIDLPDFVDSNDFHLAPGSPLIDAGDPSTGLLPPLDLDGKTRPADGNGDGTAIRDIGAFEVQPSCETDQSLCTPPTCATDPSLCSPPTCETQPSVCPDPPGDRTPPVVSKVKFFRKSNGDTTVTCRLSESARLKLAFKSRPAKPARGGKRKTVTITRQAKQGPVKIKLGKRRLKPGRYRLVIVAVDKSFNRSKPVAKNVNVQQTRATAKDDFEPA